MGLFSTIATAGVNNYLAQQRESRAREENFMYGEKAANAADARTRALYNDLYSPAAQMQQLKEAGLSPSIYASGGLAGKSGSSGAQGSGASGISPNVFGLNATDVANIELMKSQARKNNAEANTEEQTGVEKANAEIKKIYAETLGEYAATEFVRTQTEWQNLMNDFKSQTWAYDIQIQAGNAQKLKKECELLQTQIASEDLQLALDETLFNTRIKQENANLENTYKDILLKNEQIKLTKKQVDNIVAETQKLYYDMQVIYAKYWQDEKRLIEEINAKRREYNLECKKYGLSVKEYNLDVYSKHQEAAQGWANTILGALADVTQISVFTNGQKSIQPNKKSETRTYTDKNGRQQTITTEY